MARKRMTAPRKPPTIVTFQFQDRTYEIDAEARKVYRRFVEIETSKASEILSIWRAGHAIV